MTTLREALAAKRVRETTYLLAIADDAKARESLAEAKTRSLLAGVGKNGDNTAKVAAEWALEQAQKALEECYYPLRLRGIPAADLEALIAAHPPKDGEDEDGASWDKDSLLAPLVAATAVESDLTDEEWAKELASDRWTKGDLDRLFFAAMGVCLRAANDPEGKG